ncbi:MCP four helix bundle domain-containing protein, partial [Wolinella succinogenes]|uniref:MCP four helix bundle domain-containing protein n=1 Tax=Wolinella succinogenes TaxID=844 RepID=UPI00240A2923
MGWIQDWKVRTKIVVIVAVFALVAGAIGWRGLSGADLLNSSITTIVQVNVPRIAESQSLLVNLLQLQRTEKNHILSESQEQLEQRERNYRKKEEEIAKQLKLLEGLVSEQNRIKVKECAESFKKYSQTVEKVLELSRAGMNDQATKISQNEARIYMDRCEELMTEIVASNEENLSITDKETNELYEGMRYSILVIIIVGLAIAFLMSMLVIKNITHALTLVKSGLLSFFSFLSRESKEAQLINLSSKDEFGEMAGAINENIKRIQKGLLEDTETVQETLMVVNRIKEGHLNQAIHSLPDNPQLLKLKELLNEMLASLNQNFQRVLSLLKSYAENDFRERMEKGELKGEVASLIEGVNYLGGEITKMLQSSLDSGHSMEKQARLLQESMEILSQGANEQAASLEESAAAIEEMSSSMGGISHRAEEVSKQTEEIRNVIMIIRDIADQTNLLALNAAIEAARA